MKLLAALLGLLCLSRPTLAADSFTLFHYNIKELDTWKFDQSHPQLKAAVEVLSQHSFDILSINELQYDLPGVPNTRHTSKGKNIERLAELLGLTHWQTSFDQANTGRNARPKKDGSYARAGEAGWRDLADLVNFGVFPGQYSTGALSRFPIVAKKVISRIQWKKVFPTRKISGFTDAKGRPLPQTMELFDKNLTHLTLKVGTRLLDVVFLHTVPSYHFGNQKSPNEMRNADQLRFLEWYLTGTTDRPLRAPKGVTPLSPGRTVIAVGDFNVSYKNDNEGGKVMRNLLQKMKLWHPGVDYTSESGGFRGSPMKLMLDYILYNSGLNIVDSQAMTPPSRWRDLGCKHSKPPQAPEGRVVVNYNKNCYASVDRDYYRLKKASDHFPIWARFRFTNKKERR
jgi:endonuclease/exonuclease/phosphatase family metal-dependent hydrolase